MNYLLLIVVFFTSVRLTIGADELGTIDVTGLVTIGSCVFYVIIVFLLKLKIYGRTNFLLVAMFFLLIVFQLIRSPNPNAAISYFVLMTINLGMLVTAMSRLDFVGLSRINRYLYVLGVILYTPLFLYFLFVLGTQSDSIISNPKLWEMGGLSVYEVQFGNIIAFQAMVGDPNLVGPAAAIFFYLGLTIRFQTYDFVRYFGNAILFFSIFFSNSRGALISLIAGILLSAICENGKKFGKSFMTTLSLIFLMLISIVVSMLSGAFGNPFLKVQKGAGRRFEEWERIFDGFYHNPVLGSGLGYNKMVLGKQAENGYLNLIVELGVIGFFVFFLLVVLGLIQYKRYVKSEYIKIVVRPWLMYLLFMLFAMMYTSSEVSANYWLSLAVIVAAGFRSKYELKTRENFGN